MNNQNQEENNNNNNNQGLNFVINYSNSEIKLF